MTGRLEGKVAIVTGAGSIRQGLGNGKAAAILFAREGARVVLVDNREDALRETEALIRQEGGTCESIVCDVSMSDQVRAMVERTREVFGGRIDVLHNNVGIAVIGDAVTLPEEEWDRVQAVNVKSMFLTCKHVIPTMVQQGAGAIVNVSSIAGIRSLPGGNYLSYYTTKGAVLPFTRAIAVQHARQGIRANAVLPGLMDTPMADALGQDYADALTIANREQIRQYRADIVPMGRMGDAWDVARAALFLASDESRYVTGAELVVDGGLTCKVA
jgi:NAD(P)-dependent dehydrogenase (short-subunit alcohol dehydrogenase family)